MKPNFNMSYLIRKTNVITKGLLHTHKKYKFFSSSAATLTNVPKLSESDVNKLKNVLLDALKPKEIVDQLDKFIIGQADAKRAVVPITKYYFQL